MRTVRSSLVALAAATFFFSPSVPEATGARAAASRLPSPESSVQARPSSSPATASASQSVSDFEQRLSRINGQIKDLKARIAAEARKESSVLSSLARVNLNKSLVQKELAAQNVELERARADLASIKADIRAIRSNLDRERESIEKTLVTLYKFGRLDFFQFLLQARDIETYASENKNLAILARHQENVVSGFLRSLDELRSAEAALDSKQRDLAGMVRAANLKKQELETEARKYAALVLETRKNKDTFKQTLEELSASANELQKMMNKIISQEWVLPTAFIPLYERRGRLPWPLEGKVITNFGFERHPDFKTMVMNKGVEINPGKDKSLILSVHTGKVVYADYFQGYGNLIIVDHGMTYYSLYGHCAEFLVVVGDMVRAGQPVAMVGDTGSLKGECLYFELRYKTKALDPLQWLKRR
ncbi:MAG: peptidoglycan DD-metalloendopeptidase family protein [Acidobacteria bacterium]|nr:peptidoglycan DD-metalloendopeptidase family protein [Acidobacteriota bacterium]